MSNDGEVILYDAEQTLAAGRRLGALLRAGDVVALIGALGAGKTQMVRGVAAGMGLDPWEVSSPTFVLMQEYTPPETPETPENPDDENSDALTLVHIDAYRLSGAEEFMAVLWGDDGEELLDAAAVVVEWADIVEDALGEDVLQIELSHHAQGRLLRWQTKGTWRLRRDELMLCFEDGPTP